MVSLSLCLLDSGLEIGADELKIRDAIGFWNEPEFQIKAKKNSKILVLEVPMELPDYFK